MSTTHQFCNLMRKVTIRKLFNLLRRIVFVIPFKSRYCCICRNHVSGFLSYRWLKKSPQLMEDLGVVGSDVRQFSCPRCNCHDRERHLVLYLNKLAIFEKFRNASILHFAPETQLSKMIAQLLPTRYVRCDLYPANDSIEKIDMLDMPFESQSFDVVIANHVLEHVADDVTALAELYRVCKVGGIAILQTPYSSKLASTFSDPGVQTEFARLTLYGQEDHVRLYGSDIFRRFSSVGFVGEIVWHREVLADIDAKFFGVNVAEPLFLFRRP